MKCWNRQTKLYQKYVFSQLKNHLVDIEAKIIEEDPEKALGNGYLAFSEISHCRFGFSVKKYIEKTTQKKIVAELTDFALAIVRLDGLPNNANCEKITPRYLHDY